MQARAMKKEYCLAATVAALLLSSCGQAVASPSTTKAAVTKTTVSTTTTTTGAATTSTTTTLPIAARDGGLLPQTKAKPVASGKVFDGNVQLLWDAIVSGDPQLADPFFFPLAAYIQVKGIADPVHDYDTRLIYAFDTDLLSYHRQLVKMGGKPELVGLSVPESRAEWILPGAEYNKGSYWRVYGSELKFSLNGVDHEFPIFSLISWRGVWYVVHVGPPTS